MLQKWFHFIKDDRSAPPAGYTLLQIRFVRVLALVEAMARVSCFIQDTEFPEKRQEIVRKVSDYLRTNLLTKTAAQLGLGYDNSGGDKQEDEDRKALYAWLDEWKVEIDYDDGCGFPVKLNYRSATRKRSASALSGGKGGEDSCSGCAGPSSLISFV